MTGRKATLFVIFLAGILAVPALLAVDPSTGSTGVITGKIKAAGLRDASNAVVYIASAPGQFTPRDTPTLDQRDIRFDPHVLPVLVGTTVKFINHDDVQHNVFTPSPAGDFFNLGTWPKGESKPYTFAKMGKVDLLCNVHHEMHGYVLVLQNPFFAVTDKEGNFRIENVPSGTYQLKVWHERASAAPQTIRVSGGAQAVNFELVAK